MGAILIPLSCTEKEEYPDIPHIEFESFVKLRNMQGVDEKGVLKFSFTDGDGDIGLYSWETTPPYDYNLFITYFEKQNGEFKEVILTYYNDSTQQFDTNYFHSRIPIINSPDEEKPLKGKIEIELDINNPESNYDTIRFDAYIKDRALNESNTISTPEIIVKKQ